MVSIEFLYFFLPVFMGLYAIAGTRFRSVIFLLGTVVLTLWLSPWGLVPMTVCSVSSYVFGRLIERSADKKKLKKLWLVLSAVINVSAFVLFFRSNYLTADIFQIFTGESENFKIFAVWGTGVFTLHGISYCADICRGEIDSEHSFLLTAQYICFFPCMTCGPLLRFRDVSDTLHKPLISSAKLAEGIKLLLFGYVEKLLLSNSMYELWEHINSVNVNSLSAACAWLGIIAFSFSFYYEYRAFSDIARGIGLMTGFELPENFDQPFMSGGFNEFIKRFCTTLYRWVRDYVYVPLCRGKNEKLSLWAMFLSVFIACMWFGFGRRTLLFAAFICFMLGMEFILKRVIVVIPNILRCAFMNILFLLGLPLFAFPDAEKAAGYIMSMFGSAKFSGDVLVIYVIKTSAVMLLICGFFATNIGRFVKKKITSANSNIAVVVVPLIEIGFLLLCTAFLVGGGRHLTGFLF